MLEPLLLILCLILSAFFSMTETALTSLSPIRMHQLLDHGGRKAVSLMMWRDQPNKILTTILIGNNLVNIAASVIATKMALTLFDDNIVAAVTGIMTLVILIFGEITPKTYAKHNAEKIAIPLMRFILILYYLFYAVVWFLTLLSRGIIKLLGGKSDSKNANVTEQDIEYIIDLGSKEGLLEKEQSEQLKSILEFPDKKVWEIMIPRTEIFALEINTPFVEMIKKITQRGHSRIPIYEKNIDNILGMLYAKDLLKLFTSGSSPDACDISATFNINNFLKPPIYALRNMTIDELLKKFQKDRMHLAVVIDEDGGTSGMVTLEDIIEEVLGEIYDEFDKEELLLKKLDNGNYVAHGKLWIDDLEEALSVDFPENTDYRTLAGFLISLANKLPKSGEVFNWKHLTFKILEANQKKVLKVEIGIEPESSEPPSN